MAEPGDEDLLRAVAARRDAGAFTLLLERHEQGAYAFAMNIVGNADLAQEAVQEAMMKVWLRASSFTGSGSARGWLLRVVARECLKTLRKARKAMPAMKDDPADAASSDLHGELEHNELLEALRRMLAGLPAEDRQLLALHYAGGLTHEEISGEISMPRQTVSFKLGKALERLRSKLAGAGFAAALPLVDSPSLGEALCLGGPAPHLRAQIMERIAQAGAAAGGLSLAGTTTGILAVAALLVVIGIAAIGTRGSPAATEAVSTPATPAAVPPVARNQRANSGSYTYRVSFERGPAPDLKRINAGTTESSWTWKAPSGGRPGVMRARGTKSVWVEFPYDLPPQPLLVTLKVPMGVGQETTVNTGAEWFNGETGIDCRAWVNPEKFTLRSGTQLLKFYCHGPWIVCYLHGPAAEGPAASPQLLGMRRYAAPYPARRMAMAFQSAEVEEIEVRSLAPGEIPPEVMDVEALAAALTEMPVPKNPELVRTQAKK